jgi:hypothetical protein
MYNLLVSANDHSWEGKPYELDKGSRILKEYTDNTLSEHYSKLDEPALAKLTNIPTLFAYEHGIDKHAQLGRITAVHRLGNSIRIDYEIDKSLPTLSPADGEEMRAGLDLGKLEMYRTHWALKDVDLLAVLSEGGLIDGKDLHTLARLSKTIELGLAQRPAEVEARPIAFKIPAAPPEADLISVMMPFDTEFTPVFDALSAACKSAKMRCLRADHVWTEDEIMQEIFSLIYRSRLIICDFTKMNPNVFYETGIAHTLGRPVIPTTQNISHVPFDLRHRRCLTYSNDEKGLTALTGKIAQRIRTICSAA